jgi:hypothetical protein
MKRRSWEKMNMIMNEKSRTDGFQAVSLSALIGHSPAVLVCTGSNQKKKPTF